MSQIERGASTQAKAAVLKAFGKKNNDEEQDGGSKANIARRAPKARDGEEAL